MQVCVGTEAGVFLVAGSASGAWSVQGRALDDVLVHGLVASEGEPRLVLAATRGAGLWRSRDGGQSWARVGEGVLPPKLRSPVIAETTSGRVLYVGSEPIALYRSEDDGESWVELANVREIAAEKQWRYPLASVEPHIRGVAVHPDDPRLILLAIQVGGILRSEDAGRTWQNVGADQLDPDVHSLTFAGAGSRTVYAATGGGGGHALPPPAGFAGYRSDDLGVTWRPLTTALDRTYAVPICVSPRDPDMVFLGTGKDTPPSWPARPELADAVLFRSRDGGQRWERLAAGLPAPLTMMPDALCINPRAPEQVVVGTGGEGGQLIPAERREGFLLVSQNAGDSWAQPDLRLPSIFSLAVV